jgi:hypothetical protein
MTDPSGGTETPTAAAATPGARPGPATEADTDWTDQVTDLVVDSVDKVRDRTTGPILSWSAISVHALVALILLVPIGVLFVVGMLRIATYFLPEVWMAYAAVGTIFVLVGVVLWSRRSKLPI